MKHRLDGEQVSQINADLSSNSFDLTKAVRLPQNRGVCFEGGQKHGPFEIDGPTARAWLLSPLNPNGRPNSDVVRRFLNATDIVRRMTDAWVIDFGDVMSEAEAALYEKPFTYIETHVRPVRTLSSLESHRRLWWRHHRTRPELRKALLGLTRYIVTPVLSKHRIFTWLPMTYWPTNLVDAIARDDDTTFGILHSRFHEAWALRLGTSLEDRPRYTPITTFETFPFPEGLTPHISPSAYVHDKHASSIAILARRLYTLRENWLNPPELVRTQREVVAGFPDRIMPVNDAAEATLHGRTLTKLYNERPTWLANAHDDLDAAVAAAYGWRADISEEDALAKLFELNQARSTPTAGTF